MACAKPTAYIRGGGLGRKCCAGRGAKRGLLPYLDTLVITHGEILYTKMPTDGFVEPFFDTKKPPFRVDGGGQKKAPVI